MVSPQINNIYKFFSDIKRLEFFASCVSKILGNPSAYPDKLIVRKSLQGVTPHFVSLFVDVALYECKSQEFQTIRSSETFVI